MNRRVEATLRRDVKQAVKDLSGKLVRPLSRGEQRRIVTVTIKGIARGMTWTEAYQRALTIYIVDRQPSAFYWFFSCLVATVKRVFCRT